MSETPTLLGQITGLPSSPDQAILECVPNHRLIPEGDKLVRLSIPEFTSLCPVTGQPDFAHIVIDYVPADLLIESKSLKLFMGSFRNHGAYHEACTETIGSYLWLAMVPKWMRVNAYWYPRGGIPIDVFWERGDCGMQALLPPIDIPVYRGR